MPTDVALPTAAGTRTGLRREPTPRGRIPRDWLAGYTLIAPAFLAVGLLLALAIALILIMSFWTQKGISPTPDFTLKNYYEALTSPLFQIYFIRSLMVAGATTLGTILIAYPLAYWLAFYAGRWRTLMIILITVPFWTSYLLRVFAWKIVLGYNGVINSGLKSLGLIDQPLDFLVYNNFATVMTLVHAWLPFAILPIYVALEKIDRSYLEAATDLGDGPWERFLRIVLPLSLPGVLASSLMIFVPTVGDYVTPQLVGGPDGLMIANAITAQFRQSSNWPLGSALAVCSMLIVGGLSLVYIMLSRRASERIG